MPNSKHFYSRSAGRGGIPEPTNEDARYWQLSAEGALAALDKLVPNSDELVYGIWNITSTWKSICEQTEAVLKKIREEKGEPHES